MSQRFLVARSTNNPAYFPRWSKQRKQQEQQQQQQRQQRQVQKDQRKGKPAPNPDCVQSPRQHSKQNPEPFQPRQLQKDQYNVVKSNSPMQHQHRQQQKEERVKPESLIVFAKNSQSSLFDHPFDQLDCFHDSSDDENENCKLESMHSLSVVKSAASFSQGNHAKSYGSSNFTLAPSQLSSLVSRSAYSPFKSISKRDDNEGVLQVSTLRSTNSSFSPFSGSSERLAIQGGSDVHASKLTMRSPRTSCSDFSPPPSRTHLHKATDASQTSSAPVKRSTPPRQQSLMERKQRLSSSHYHQHAKRAASTCSKLVVARSPSAPRNQSEPGTPVQQGKDQRPDVLELASNRLLDLAVLPIQRMVRQYLARCRAQKRLANIISLQAYARRLLVHRRVSCQHQAATQIQRVVRGRQARDYWEWQRMAAIVIQSNFRGFLASIQYQCDLFDIIIVQSVIRRKLAQHRVRQIKWNKAAPLIQAGLEIMGFQFPNPATRSSGDNGVHTDTVALPTDDTLLRMAVWLSSLREEGNHGNGHP